MLNTDGNVYLPYSGDVPLDSPQALLLKRAWESLRRSPEFILDCQSMSIANQPALARFREKWGVALTDPRKSFNKIVEGQTTIELDNKETFNDMYRRLYGDTFYGSDRVIQCEEYDFLCNSLSPNDFELLKAIARGEITIPPGAVSSGAPAESTIHFTIDVDQNPIAILFKVQIVLRALRQARVAAGKAEPLDARIEQQLATLTKKLEADIVGDGRRDFRRDDEIFKVWDYSRDGKKQDEIAQLVWPSEHRRDGGVRDEARDRTAVGKKVRRYRAQADAWIELFETLIKQ